MNHRTWRRIAACLLCVCLLLTAQATPTYAAGDYKSELSELNAKLDALKKEQEKIESDISKTKSEKEQKAKEKAALQDQIYLAQQQIDALSQRIDILEDNIDQKEREIAAKQAEIDANYDLYKERLYAMYKRNDATALGVMLGADTYADFLSGADTMRRISEHDDKLINDLVEAKHAIEQAQAELEEAKAQVEADKTSMDSQKANLNVKVAEVAKQEMQLADLQKEFEAQKAQKQKEEKEAQAEIKRIIAANASIGDYVGGEFAWPVYGFSTITSSFGWRFNNSDYHTGIDIAGRSAAGEAIYRQPIHAANSGKVIYASNSYTPGRGYGRYVIIDHGGGKSTLYGHQDEVTTSVGEWVAQGDVIGYVGTTGWSTGPHLHFEIRENGNAVNPMNYFSRRG